MEYGKLFKYLIVDSDYGKDNFNGRIIKEIIDELTTLTKSINSIKQNNKEN